MTGEATLSNEKNYTVFCFGNQNAEPEEEYIDLVPILQNLYFDADKFLEPIKGVKVANG